MISSSTQRTVGQLGDVAWELDIDPGRVWVAPDIFPARLLRMTDLSLVSAPLAAFTGWIRHGGQHATLQRAPGVISHYWGRQLASEWEKFEIKIRRFGAETITLTGSGRDYGDLGDRIVNTLVGDLEIREGGRLIARAQGTAGLERRAPNNAVA